MTLDDSLKLIMLGFEKMLRTDGRTNNANSRVAMVFQTFKLAQFGRCLFGGCVNYRPFAFLLATRRLAAAKFNLVHYCSAIDLKEIVQSK